MGRSDCCHVQLIIVMTNPTHDHFATQLLVVFSAGCYCLAAQGGPGTPCMHEYPSGYATESCFFIVW